MKRIPLYVKIIGGMLLGVLFAVAAIQFDGGVKFTKDWIKPFGNMLSLLPFR